MLHAAVAAGRRDEVVLLLENGADVDAEDQWGAQPLHRAAQRGSSDFCNLLLSFGAQIDALDGHGQQPLHYAAREGHDEVATLLLRWGAPVDMRNAMGATPLQRAAHGGHVEVVGTLLSHGAAPEKNAALAAELNGFVELGDWIKDTSVETQSPFDMKAQAASQAGPPLGSSPEQEAAFWRERAERAEAEVQALKTALMAQQM